MPLLYIFIYLGSSIEDQLYENKGRKNCQKSIVCKKEIVFARERKAKG